jgi:hypothetical protein
MGGVARYSLIKLLIKLPYVGERIYTFSRKAIG